MYLNTNFIVGPPSTSSLRLNSWTNISYTTHRFRTKVANDKRGPGCYARNYRHRMTADCSSSMQLRTDKKLEVKIKQNNHEMLPSLFIVKYDISVDWLTSKTTAQGAGTASNVVPVTEHVIGLVSYRVWYAARYASANIVINSNGSRLEDVVGKERIL